MTIQELEDKLWGYEEWGRIVDFALNLNLKIFPKQGNIHRCPTGDLYITICSGGIHYEGESTKTYLSETDAKVDFERKVIEYLKSKPGKMLYLRQYPTIYRHDNKLYACCRIIVSSELP